MTREEAIGRIQEHRRIHSKKEPFTPKLDEAFGMAIEALGTIDGLCKNLAWYINERNRLLQEQRPHGEWILVKPYTFKCSLCGRIEEHQEPFCNCGAKMEIRVGDKNAEL